MKYISPTNKLKLFKLEKKIKYNIKKFETRGRIYKPKYNKFINLRNLNNIRLRLIIYNNLLYKVFKIGISKKVSKVFNFFFDRRFKYEKIYYRHPFIYEVRDKIIKRKSYYTQYQFASLRVTRLFYILYTYRQLKKLCKKAKRKDGVFEQNYMLLMECKLPSFIYRTSFLPNMFDSIYFIKNSNV
jgi:hypothetical protein